MPDILTFHLTKVRGLKLLAIWREIQSFKLSDKFGSIRRSWIGVTCQDLDKATDDLIREKCTGGKQLESSDLVQSGWHHSKTMPRASIINE